MVRDNAGSNGSDASDRRIRHRRCGCAFAGAALPAASSAAGSRRRPYAPVLGFPTISITLTRTISITRAITVTRAIIGTRRTTRGAPAADAPGPTTMAALAPTGQVVAGVAIFVLAWAILAAPTPRWMPCGRAGGTLAAAALMVATGVLSPAQAMAAISLETLALLFGMMVLTDYLTRIGFVHAAGEFIARVGGSSSPMLLLRLSVVAALLSMLVTNDTACIVLTPVVVHVCWRRGEPLGPFLIALATSANIGSAATIVGNPQNAIIAATGQVSFFGFLLRILPASAIGIAVNCALLCLFYRRKLLSGTHGTATHALLPTHPAAADAAADAAAASGESFEMTERHVDRPEAPVLRHDGDPAAANASAAAAPSPTTTPRAAPAPTATPSAPGDPQCGMPLSAPDHATGFSSLQPRASRISVAGGARPVPISAAVDLEADRPPAQSRPMRVFTPAPAFAHPAEVAASAAALAAADTVGSTTLAAGFAPRPSTAPDASRSLAHADLLAASTAASGPESMVLSVRSMPPPLPASSRQRGLFASISASQRARLFKIAVLLTAVGVMAALLAGLSVGWSPVGGAGVLFLTDALLNGMEADDALRRVDWVLLAFFSGLFVVMAGLTATGIPAVVWDYLSPVLNADTPLGLVSFAAFVLILGNLISNVPLVLLVSPLLLSSGDTTRWYELAWVSTVSGNLTLVGSVANLIVAERAKLYYKLTFWEYLVFGVPSTLLIVTIGVPIVYGISIGLQ